MAKKFQIFQECRRELAGISLINFGILAMIFESEMLESPSNPLKTHIIA